MVRLSTLYLCLYLYPSMHYIAMQIFSRSCHETRSLWDFSRIEVYIPIFNSTLGSDVNWTPYRMSHPVPLCLRAWKWPLLMPVRELGKFMDDRWWTERRPLPRDWSDSLGRLHVLDCALGWPEPVAAAADRRTVCWSVWITGYSLLQLGIFEPFDFDAFVSTR